jgi:hypothetical protein
MSKLNVMTIKEMLETDTSDMCQFAQIKKLPSHSLNERCVVRVADDVRPVICQPPDGLYQREAATMPEFLIGVLAHAMGLIHKQNELPGVMIGPTGILKPRLLYWGKDCVPCDQPSWLMAYKLV